MEVSDNRASGPAWDEETQRLFNQKIARSRNGASKWQHFSTQAAALFNSETPVGRQGATELLYRALNEVSVMPNDTRCYAHTLLGDYLREQDHLPAAEYHYRAAIDSLPLAQRQLHAPLEPEERLGALLVRSEDPARREEGDLSWKLYYQGPRWQELFPIYEDLESKPVNDRTGELYAFPTFAAEAILDLYQKKVGMDVLMEGKRPALAALDEYFRSKPASRAQPRREYPPEVLTNHFVAELSSFFGRVFLNERGGNWLPGETLMRSRIRVGTLKINPFLCGYKAVFFEYSLLDLLDNPLWVGSSGRKPNNDDNMPPRPPERRGRKKKNV
jgi:hypothetical protein